LVPERGAMGFVAGSSAEPMELFVVGPPKSIDDILLGNAGCSKVKHDSRKIKGQPNSLVHERVKRKYHQAGNVGWRLNGHKSANFYKAKKPAGTAFSDHATETAGGAVNFDTTVLNPEEPVKRPTDLTGAFRFVFALYRQFSFQGRGNTKSQAIKGCRGVVIRRLAIKKLTYCNSCNVEIKKT
jgi:hypothetical protein